jgi:hypothetical protein
VVSGVVSGEDEQPRLWPLSGHKNSILPWLVPCWKQVFLQLSAYVYGVGGEEIEREGSQKPQPLEVPG